MRQVAFAVARELDGRIHVSASRDFDDPEGLEATLRDHGVDTRIYEQIMMPCDQAGSVTDVEFVDARNHDRITSGERLKELRQAVTTEAGEPATEPFTDFYLAPDLLPADVEFAMFMQIKVSEQDLPEIASTDAGFARQLRDAGCVTPRLSTEPAAP